MINRLKEISSPLREAFEVILKISSHFHYKVYLVGGCVRDIILGKKQIFDIDIVVEGDAILLATEFSHHFNREITRHHSFGTATVNFLDYHFDFATARKEVYPHPGALPRVSTATLKEDLLRRDFTINAIALSLNKKDYGKIIDLYGGLEDIRKRLIRVLHNESFLDDPTRMLRAIRFATRFNFKIERQTLKLLKEANSKGALFFVNPHRIRDELILILKEERPYKYLKKINFLLDFSFISPQIKLTRQDFLLLKRIEHAIGHYYQNFKHRKLENWILYLGCLLLKIKRRDILYFLERFGLRKQERKKILSIRDNFKKVKKLNQHLPNHKIYEMLSPLSYEEIIFFYAYYPYPLLRFNIKLYLEKLIYIRLHIKGDDLINLGIKPAVIFKDLLKKVMRKKLDKNLHSREQELEELMRNYSKIKCQK